MRNVNNSFLCQTNLSAMSELVGELQSTLALGQINMQPAPETRRKAIDEAAKAGDADTSDLFTGISRGADKSLWLLEAHLQADR